MDNPAKNPPAATGAMDVSRPHQASRADGVTPRVVALCLLLAVAFGYISPIIDLQMSNTFLGGLHLPPGAVGVLLLLVAANPLLRVLNARFVFSRNEVLVVYICALFAALVPGHGSESSFVPMTIGVLYYATPDNKWLGWLEPHLKPWLSPALGEGRYGEAGKAVAEGWYNGAGGDVPWGAWLVPLAVWGALVLAIYVMLGCLGVLLRAQWGERESLRFPLLQLPLTLTEDMEGGETKSHFFHNQAFRVGFGVAACIQFVNGLNVYFPDVPRISLSIDTSRMFTESPWNQLGGVNIIIWPIVVGITYLLTTEASFSLWFFFWFVKGQYIVASSFGFTPAVLPLIPIWFEKTFTGYQIIGAYLALFCLSMWTGREHFAHIVRRAFGHAGSTPSERDEAMSYPLAFWGFALSLAVLIAWSMAVGMSAPVALALWFGYLVFAVTLTRVVVEGGLLFVGGPSALGLMTQLGGSGAGTWLPASSVVPATFVSSGIDTRAFLLPSFLHAFKLAHDRKIRARPMLALIAAVIVIAFTVGVWMKVRLGYLQSGLTLNGWTANIAPRVPAWNIGGFLQGTEQSPLNWVWIAVGAVLTWGMMTARSLWPGFPLHPLGWLVASSYAMSMMWFSIFVGWGCKLLVMRFGGHEAYRKTVPLFLGLALGDVALMLFWLAIDGWQGRTGHYLMPP